MKVSGVFGNPDKTRQVPAGTVIFREGDVGSDMFGIVEGEVELRSASGVIAKLGANEVFGEMAIIDSSPRMATAEAIADTVLVTIDRRHFLFLVHETPMFALQVMSTMAERLRHPNATSATREP